MTDDVDRAILAHLREHGPQTGEQVFRACRDVLATPLDVQNRLDALYERGLILAKDEGPPRTWEAADTIDVINVPGT
jgi:DNA-binding Lrp family transcriptional regulator